MKSYLKNPVFYYVLIPILAAFWPLLVWSVYLPESGNTFITDKGNYLEAEEKIKTILEIDPERLNTADAGTKDEFDYTTTISEVAKFVKISAANYKISSGTISTSAGQKSQSAKVLIKNVDISSVAMFLSRVLLKWENLQCTRLRLTKNKGLPDNWNADIDLKYYF